MLKIGVFTRNINELSNFEYRFYKYCKDQPWIDISLLVLDGRIKKKKVFFKKIIRLNIFPKIIFYIINQIDSKFSLFPKLSDEDKKTIIKWLKKIKSIYIYPISKDDNVDYFDKKITKEINNYKLDLIIRNEFGIIKGEILNALKYGIWSFHHSDNDIIRGGPAGFWEIIYNHDVTGVTLQKINEDLDGGDIIDKSFYVTQKTFLQNNNFIIEKSLTVLIKNLIILNDTKKLITFKSNVYNKNLYKYPQDYYTIFKYIYILIKNLIIKKIIQKLLFLFKYRLNHWIIQINESDSIENFDIKKSIQIKSNKNYFYADPFYINYQNKDLVFYEKFSYKNNKGLIACSEIINNRFVNEFEVLVKDYHLSYPFIFNYNENYYMMPESSTSKRMEIYISKNFPYKWELYKTIFNNEYTADPTLFVEKNNNCWLFINKSSDPYNDLNSELYIYKVKNFNFDSLIPHKKNPVVIDSRFSRNAGNIFYHNDQIIRPSQHTNNKAYGNSLNLSIITKLDINNYEEKLIKNINALPLERGIGVHHFSLYKDKFIIDTCYNFF